MMHGQKNIKIV